jgi:hypothetical protein
MFSSAQPVHMICRPTQSRMKAMRRIITRAPISARVRDQRRRAAEGVEMGSSVSGIRTSSFKKGTIASSTFTSR